MLIAVDEADDRGRQVRAAASQPVMSITTDDAADGGGGGGGGHYCYSSHHESSSVDNNAVSWTSAEVKSWLERRQLQHLADWYV